MLGSPAIAPPRLAPSVRYTPFSGAEDTLAAMQRMVHGPGGEKSVTVRRFTEWVVRGIEPKDYHGEILAIRHAFLSASPGRGGLPLFRYTNDPRHIEWLKSPERIVRELEQHGSALIDCDESTCLAATMALQLGRDAQLVGLGYGPQLTHVGVRVMEPKSNRWIWLDSVAGPRERAAAATSKKRVFWSLD